jgi:thiamine monophosphate synthase
MHFSPFITMSNANTKIVIGGIKRANLPEVIAAGARRVVIVSDLLAADDVESATREVREIIARS